MKLGTTHEISLAQIPILIGIYKDEWLVTANCWCIL